MNIADRISALQSLSTAELAAEYEGLYHRKPRYRHPAWLRKRVAFKLQENAYGGLSRAARAELSRLAADLELPQAATQGRVAHHSPKRSNGQPRPGTVLQREWRGQQVRVEVLADGFSWDGNHYGSLSAVARAVTGTRWNGRLFFGLTGRAKS